MSYITFFADDLHIYLHALPRDICDAVARINVDASSVSDWATNGLKLNVGKTKAIVLGSSAYVSQVAPLAFPPIVIDSGAMPYVESSWNLGVYISANLFWSSDLARISIRVHASFHRLNPHRNLVSPQVKTLVATVFIIPHIGHCNSVYIAMSLTLCNDKLERLVNCGIRFIFNLWKDVHTISDRENVTVRNQHRRTLRVRASVCLSGAFGNG